MTTYYYKIKKINLTSAPDNSYIQLDSYLADSTGFPVFSSSSDSVDSFAVVTEKTSLPPSNYQSFFEQLVLSFINTKYTVTLSGETFLNSDIITVTSTTGVMIGMSVSGTHIPSGSTVVSVRDSSSLKISQVATASEANLTFTFAPTSWTINYDSLAYFLDVVNLDQL